eukprot:COSAG01_NODE_3229_length_6382_cov_76.522521_3_plen_343_part_00
MPFNTLAIKLDYDVRIIRSVPINFAVPCLHRESRPRTAPRLYSFTVSIPFRVPVPTLGIVLSYWYAYARRHCMPAMREVQPRPGKSARLTRAAVDALQSVFDSAGHLNGLPAPLRRPTRRELDWHAGPVCRAALTYARLPRRTFRQASPRGSLGLAFLANSRRRVCPSPPSSLHRRIQPRAHRLSQQQQHQHRHRHRYRRRRSMPARANASLGRPSAYARISSVATFSCAWVTCATYGPSGSIATTTGFHSTRTLYSCTGRYEDSYCQPQGSHTYRDLDDNGRLRLLHPAPLPIPAKLLNVLRGLVADKVSDLEDPFRRRNLDDDPDLVASDASLARNALVM